MGIDRHFPESIVVTIVYCSHDRKPVTVGTIAIERYLDEPIVATIAIDRPFLNLSTQPWVLVGPFPNLSLSR